MMDHLNGAHEFETIDNNLRDQFANPIRSFPTNSSSYINHILRRRRNQRQLKNRITMYTPNNLRQLPRQNTNNPFARQLFHGSTFH
jgi:hypothetical protein